MAADILWHSHKPDPSAAFGFHIWTVRTIPADCLTKSLYLSKLPVTTCLSHIGFKHLLQWKFLQSQLSELPQHIQCIRQ